MGCEHIITQGREGETGCWCRDCGLKVMAVETNECRDCDSFFQDGSYSGCSRHLMRVTPDMQVMYKLSIGSCFTRQKAAKAGK